MVTASDAALIAFEKQADDFVSKLPVLQLPARAVLSAIHLSLFLMLRAPSLGLSSAAPKGQALMSRLGYLLPLLRKLPALPTGVDAADAIGGYQEVDPHFEQLGILFSYAHFSQIMPEFHRGYFSASINPAGFHLSHRSTAFAEAEAKDILLSELALPYVYERPQLPDDDVVALAKSAPKMDLAVLSSVLKRKFASWRKILVERPLINDAGLHAVFGFDHETYRRIQSATLAYAEFCDELSWLIAGWSALDNGGAAISPESLEWITVNNDPDFITGVLASISQTSQNDVLSFLAYYTIDYTSSGVGNRGADGFLPPVAKFQNMTLFSPALVMTFVHARNAIFDFSRLNKKAFDERVSRELEPVLLDQLIDIVSEKTSWIMHKNVQMPGGEIDLVIIDPECETVVILQAKGPIPPQGARMAERLATRCKEGLMQLDRFRVLPDSTKQDLLIEKLNSGLGRPVFHYALLARSCFGTPEIWEREGDIILLTLPLVGLAVAHLAIDGRAPSLSAFPDAVRTVRDDFFAAAKPVWDSGVIHIMGKEISVPLLLFQDDVVEDARQASSKRSHTSHVRDKNCH